MSRRPLALLVFVAASFVISACSQLTAPRRDDEEGEGEGEFPGCRTVLVGSSGRYCADVDSIVL